MLSDNVLVRDLNEFVSAPEFKGNMLVRPSRLYRLLFGLALLAAVLLFITGLANIYAVLNRTDHPISDTLMLGGGLMMILLAGGLIWRFTSPFLFAVAVTTEGLAWRTIFGWHHTSWDKVQFALVQPHSAYGGREVHIGAGKVRLHFGWFDVTDWLAFGPLESLPSAEAKSLLHTIARRAALQEREPGVWVRNGDEKIVVDTGQFRW